MTGTPFPCLLKPYTHSPDLNHQGVPEEVKAVIGILMDLLFLEASYSLTLIH